MTDKKMKSLEERKVEALEGVKRSIAWLSVAVAFAAVVNGFSGPSSLGIVVLDGSVAQGQPHQQMPDQQPLAPKSKAPILI
jgi:hypothetical protein